jgi:crooked neck
MEWQPKVDGWMAFVKMELRYNEIDLARKVLAKFVGSRPEVSSYLKYAQFEEKHGSADTARDVFETAIENLAEFGYDEELYGAFASFEQRVKEPERARAIFRFGLDNIPKHLCAELYKSYVAFEKTHGDKKAIEATIASKRRIAYEAEVAKAPSNYDNWFDYARLEEGEGDAARVRDVYERAIANVPPTHEKRHWQRYIYLWINYAMFEELDARDVDKTRAVYSQCLRVVPHASFTFSKVWVMAAHFEVRQKNLKGARKILGTAVGKCPKEKTFKSYIELEMALTEFDRCRTLYNKYLEWNLGNCAAWIRFAEMERALDEVERSRAILQLAVSQPVLDMPELLWKAFIDFEIELGENERARTLYEGLLERTQHVKVWASYAAFEAGPAGDANKARAVFQRAYDHFKGLGGEHKEQVRGGAAAAAAPAAAAALASFHPCCPPPCLTAVVLVCCFLCRLASSLTLCPSVPLNALRMF